MNKKPPLSLSLLSLSPLSLNAAWRMRLGACLLCGTLAGAASLAHAQSAASGVTVAADSKMDRADARWMQRLARLHAAQVEAGKLAVAQSQRDSIRKFGQGMADEHAKAARELNALATQKRVLLTNQPDGTHHKELVRLATLTGTAFDLEYMRLEGIRDHTDLAKLLQEGIDRAKDADLKVYAGQSLSLEKQHFDTARDINVPLVERTQTPKK